jgi:ADP-ribose pyrophosphatase
MLDKIWKTLKEKVVYDTPWMSVIEETLKLPDGTIVENYSTVKLRDVVAVFPMTPENEVIMVRQYRHAVRKMMLELPAGTYDKEKEKPADAMRRELQEETGYVATDLHYLGKLYEYPTKASHKISIYFTDKLKYNPIAHNDPMENVEVVKIPLDKIDQYILDGTIESSGTIAAISMVKTHLKKSFKNI